MAEWIDRLAEGMGVQTVSAAETERLLRASREVAHRVERKLTPLATFLLGLAVATRTAQGASRETAFEDALDALLRRLPEAPPNDGGGGAVAGGPENAGRE